MAHDFVYGYPAPRMNARPTDRAMFAAITAELLLSKGIKTSLTEEEIDAQYETFQYEPAREAWWKRLWERLLMENE